MSKQKNRCERNVVKTAATAKNSAQPSRRTKKDRVAGAERRVRRDAKLGDEGVVASWLLTALDEIDAFAEERAAYVARIRSLEAELKAMREASYAASA